MSGICPAIVRDLGHLPPECGHLRLALALLSASGVSAARPVVEGAQLFLKRSIRGQALRLRPCERTNQIVLYIVAVVAQRTGVRLHSITVASDGWELVVTDPKGRVCDFTRDCHNFIAKHINATFGDEGALWDDRQTEQVDLDDPNVVLATMAESLAAPVTGYLVEHGEEYPGIRRSWPAPALELAKPEGYFAPREAGGTWPETVVLEMARPPGHRDLSDTELAERLDEAVQVREQKARDAARRAGIRFVGAERILARPRHTRASAPRRARERTRRFACATPERERQRERSHRAWRARYDERFARWRAGERDVVFPHGTYKMRVVHSARCAPPPG